MNLIFLTQNETFIIGWVAKLLGIIMNGIFYVIDKIGIPNIGLAIIIFTIVIYLLMMPLTIKQQKFSKLNAKINPEIQAIQAKYKGRKDQDAAMAQNQEIQAVYAKYGVSPSGSCVQLLIQMPILFALYRVIYSMPAYVTKIRDTFMVLATKIIDTDNGDFLLNSGIETINNTVNMYGKSMKNGNLTNGVIDVLNKLSSVDMAAVAEHYGLNSCQFDGQYILTSGISGGVGLIDKYNNFLGLNMGDSPMNIIKLAWAAGTMLLVIGAVMIPLLSAATQWINIKLMPQPEDNKDANDQQAAMAQSMKTMNMMMPIMSAYFCLTLPAGMGLYWIAGSVVRSIQQVIVNKHLDKMDFDEIIEKNSAKSAKKMEKLKANQERINAYAEMKTKNLQTKANVNPKNNSTSSSSSSTSTSTTSTTSGGSMRNKANMVKKFNEQNNNNE